MTKILVALFYPAYWLLYHLCRDKKAYEKDLDNWCQWKEVERKLWNGCKLFIDDKAFRNLSYHRMGRWCRIVSWMLPGYDHLQITTPSSNIGGGLIIQHGFATIISAKKIGKNCKIYQQVTIGYNHSLKAPSLGDNVEVCCGAKIIGGIKIGNNVLIGANAVVSKDLPDNCVAAGVPAKIIRLLPANEDVFDRIKQYK